MSSGWIGSARWSAIGPLSSPSVSLKIVTPVYGVARHQRALDRRGAAPARQQGRMDVQHQVVRQERLADQLPELAHADPLGRRGVDRGARLRRRSRSRPAAPGCRGRARPARPGGGAVLRPRPCGRSGGVTTSTGRCGGLGQRAQHHDREAGAAEEDGPHGAALSPRCGRWRSARGECCSPAAAQGAQRFLALLLGGAIEDQDPVEVVHLVLDHARLEP